MGSRLKFFGYPLNYRSIVTDADILVMLQDRPLPTGWVRLYHDTEDTVPKDFIGMLSIG